MKKLILFSKGKIMEPKFCRESKICPDKGTHVVKNGLVHNIYNFYIEFNKNLNCTLKHPQQI